MPYSLFISLLIDLLFCDSIIDFHFVITIRIIHINFYIYLPIFKLNNYVLIIIKYACILEVNFYYLSLTFFLYF